MKEKKRGRCAVCACFNLRKASRVITQLYGRKLAPDGLRSTQFSIMAVFATSDPRTLTRVAETLAMDRTTLTRNLRLMEKPGVFHDRPGRGPAHKENNPYEKSLEGLCEVHYTRGKNTETGNRKMGITEIQFLYQRFT